MYYHIIIQSLESKIYLKIKLGQYITCPRSGLSVKTSRRCLCLTPCPRYVFYDMHEMAIDMVITWSNDKHNQACTVWPV